MSENTFYKDLVACLGSLPALHFDATNPHFKSDYLSLSGLLNGIRPTLAKFNLCLSQDVRIDSGAKELCIRTSLIHSSGQKLESSEARFPITNYTPQGIGSVQTYARRYCALALLGVSGDADDDGQAAQPAPKKAPIKVSQLDPDDGVPF